MYRVAWSAVYPVNPWILRCTESGAAYPNGRKQDGTFMVGQHPKRFPDAPRAFQYAEKYGIELEPIPDRASSRDATSERRTTE